MKRLVNESADELTRSLLVAGIEHRPAPGNKARVIMAIGAGGTLGLFSSNAFAWLGTTAGKVAAVGVAVGFAGAVFIAAPELLRQESAPRAAVSPRATLPTRASPPTPGRGPSLSAGASVAGEGASLAAPSSSPGIIVSGSPTSADTASGNTASGNTAASGKTATKKLSAWRERRLAARRRAAQSKPSPGGPGESVAEVAPAIAEPAPAAPPAEGLDLIPTNADLDSEVRLVDDMHWAARRNDREALGRFLERYRETFPDGQLKKEVAQFAARLEQPDTSRTP